GTTAGVPPFPPGLPPLDGRHHRPPHDPSPGPAVTREGQGAPDLRPGLATRDAEGHDCAGGQRALEKASAAEPSTTLRTRRVDHGRRDLHSRRTSNQSLRTKSPYLVPAIVPRQATGDREPFQPVGDDSDRLPGVNHAAIEGVSAMDLGLKGRVALVTGGSKGIGKAVARGLVEEGVRVAICARSKASLEEAARELAGAAG